MSTLVENVELEFKKRLTNGQIRNDRDEVGRKFQSGEFNATKVDHLFSHSARKHYILTHDRSPENLQSTA